MITFVCLALFCAVISQPVCSMPLHASCKIQWDWPQTSCKEVESAIVKQISVWNNTNCKDVGEKCRYALLKRTPSLVTATHTTPVKNYVDDLTFEFTNQSGGCHVEAKSSSETWYAVLDYGTNYCNLRNLITGAGLDKVTGFKQTTSNSVCTQYSSADCEKY